MASAVSTAQGSPRPPTPLPASPCPALRKRSATPARNSPQDNPPRPGDLVFFGTGADRITYVGIAISATNPSKSIPSGATSSAALGPTTTPSPEVRHQGTGRFVSNWIWPWH